MPHGRHGTCGEIGQVDNGGVVPLSPMTFRRSSRLSLLAAALPLLTLVACSSPREAVMERAIEDSMEGEADVDMRMDGSMKIETEEGTFETGGSVPAGWPEDVPVYAGADVQYSGTSNPQTGEAGLVLILLSTDDPATITDFYETSLTAAGWTMQGTLQNAGTSIFSAVKDNRTVGMSITGAEGATTISIGIETKNE